MSFNPEAAAFSPTTASAKAAETSDAATGHVENVSFDSLSQAIPMEVLMRTLAGRCFNPHPNARPLTVTEHPMMSIQDLIGSSPNTYAPPQQPIDYAAGHQPTFKFSLRSTEPNLNIVDIDELSASLGLPSAKQEANPDDTPARMHKARPSQGGHDALYGKLIDKALNKPLTADALAHYMRSRSESSEETVKPSQSPHDPFIDYGTPADEQGPALKVVQPPPGFGVQMPRMVATKDERTHTDAMHHNIAVAQAAPPGYFHRHPRQDLDSGPVYPIQHHARHSVARRHPRRHTRTKRTDQGPEPSAADIYPDDAHWTPTQQPYRQNYFSPPPPVVHVEDAASWPTPAEVFQPKPSAPTPQPYEPHVSPTAEDLNASDADVHSLLHDLPDGSIPTLIMYGAYDLLNDERSLSPDQSSGKRYGVNFYGIGLGDEWQPPKQGDGSIDRYRADPFRVRPRDHEGWGGWEWAIKKS